MSDYDGLRGCDICGNYTTGRLCRSCAEQEAIDNDADVPLPEVLSVDALEDYEAAQVAQARALIEERERVWDSDRRALVRVMTALYGIDPSYIAEAEAQRKAERNAV